MSQPLRALILEDNSADVELSRHALHKAGYDVELVHVADREGFAAQLGLDFDVILADYSLPQFGAREALQMVQARGLDVPFLVVSGTIGEDLAVEMIKLGAADYLLKDRLGRLGAAVRQAQEQRGLRKDRLAVEDALRSQDRLFRAVVEHAADGMALLKRDLSLAYLSPTAERMVGLRAEDFPGRDPVEVIHPEDQGDARQAMQAALEHPGQVQRLDVRMRKYDGTWRWVECAVDNQLDHPDVEAVVINMRDIDGRRRAEEALRKSEEHYRLLFEGNPQPMWIYDLETLAIRAVNEVAVQTYGFTSAEFLQLSILDLRPPEDRAALVEALRLPSARIRRPTVATHVRRDGSRLEAEIVTHDLDFDGRPARLVMALDVTERERARRDLESSERRYRELTEEAPIGIYRTAPDGRILFVNPALARMLGYDSPTELTARSIETGPFEASYQRADFKRRLETEGEVRGLEASWTRKDGSRLFIRENARLVRSQKGDGIYYEGTVEDVSEQKRAEDELRRRSEEILLLYEAGRALGQTLDLEALFDLAYQAIARVMDCSDFYVSTFDPAAETIRCAYARHGEAKLDAAEFPVIPLDPGGQGTQSRVIRSGETLYLPDEGIPWRTARHPFLIKAGGVLTASTSDNADVSKSTLLVPLKLEGRVTGVMQVFSQKVEAYHSDQIRFLEALAPQLAAAVANARLFRRAQEEIRERRQAEQAVRQLSEFNEGIVRNMTEGIVLEEADETLSFVNPAAASMLGYTVQELTGRTLSSIIRPDQIAMVRAANERRAQGKSDRYELQFVRKDGERITALVSGSPRFEDGHYAGTIAVFTDISDLKAAQRDIARRAEQMQALYQTSLEINAQPSLETVLQAIVERATTLLGVQAGGLYLLRPDGETLEFAVVHGMLEEYRGTTLRRGEALSGKVLETGRTIVVEDYMNWPERSPLYEGTTFRRILAVPLTVGRRIVGVLNATDMDKPGSFSPEEIRLAELFADQAALAVENARLLEAERQRVDYLEGVTEASTALRAAGNRAQMLPIISGQVAKLLDTPHVGLALTVSDGDVEMLSGGGVLSGLVGQRGPVAEGLVGQIMTTGKAFLTTDIAHEEHVLSKDLFQGVSCVVGVPLVSQDRRIGAILAARASPFNGEELRLLTAIAEMAGNALNRAGVMETLEQRVAERTSDLAAANARLQELDQLKSAFVSNVSHELRSPITNILLYLDLLAEPSREARRPTYMGILRGEAGRLHRLIEDLLTLSRLERGAVALDFEPQVLDALIAEVMASQEARAQLKALDLRHEPNPNMPLASVAHGPMVQVLTNLIANAVNYSPAGATVTTSTRVDEDRGRRYAAIRVHNSKPAIPEEDLPHLFERFYRGRAAAESGEAGTGLGLAICKEIVERHGGWIDVESAPETGTAFTVWLPLGGLTPT